MNVFKISDMVRNEGYKICDFDASVCERTCTPYSVRRSCLDDEECEDPDDRTRMVRTINIRLFRNNENVHFSEKYDSDQHFGKDAAELSKLISEVGTAKNLSNKRRR